MNGVQIDFHAHVLPGADHGSDSVETSLFQLAQAARAGVSTIVATPHFYPHKYRNVEEFLKRRQESLAALQGAYRGDISILPAAEVLLCEGIEHLPELEKLCISNTRTILIEMPMTSWSQRHIDTLFAIRQECGLRVVLAHVDRYPYDQIGKLLRKGLLGQINAENICRLTVRRRYLELAGEPCIVALGSDIHQKDPAYEKFSKAIALLGQTAQPLMQRSAQMLC
jgi:protein-tyrosine phosphatase